MRKSYFSFLIIAHALLCACTERTKLSVPDTSAWTFTGIGGGGAMFNPAISPHNPNKVFVSCDMTGSYTTEDGGNSWRMFNLRGPVSYYVFDPLDENVVYANSIGLFKSKDRGITWSLVYPPLEEVSGVVSKGDHANEYLVTTDSTRRNVLCMAIDPVVSEHLYAVIAIENMPALYVSRNGGIHWEKEFDLPDRVKDIFIMPSSSLEDRTLLLTTSKGIWKRERQNWSFAKAPSGVQSLMFFSGGYEEATNRFIVYAISGQSYFNPAPDVSGIFFTDDGGKTWSNRQSGIASLHQEQTTWPEWRAVATSFENPAVLYVSYNNLKIHEDTTCIGVAKSVDYGQTWKLVWKDKITPSVEIPSPNFRDAWLNDRFGPTWGENPFSLAVHAKNPQVCFGTDFGRTVKTADGGETWEEAYSKEKVGYGWVSRGLEVTTSYSLVTDPFDPDHMFITTTDIGLIESRDGGISWRSATVDNGVPAPWVNSTYWLEFDPDVKGRVWAVMSGTHDLPRPKMWRNRSTTQYKGGILISENGGSSWSPVSGEIGEAAVTHILLDRNSDPANRTLYACVFGKGVYKSVDGGKSWLLKNDGIREDNPMAWRLALRSDGTLFLVNFRRSEDGSIGTLADGRVYRSNDGADMWQEVVLPEGVNGPTSLVVDPDQNGRLLLSAWGRPVKDKFTSDVGGGIFLSEDDGETWSNELTSDQHIHDITYDPRTKVFYSCGFNGAAYRSENGGKNWERLGGYSFKWGKRVEPDTRDPEKVFIITFGGGVWHGPARGEQHVRPDIYPPLPE